MRLNLAIVVGLMCVAVLVSAGSAGGAVVGTCGVHDYRYDR